MKIKKLKLALLGVVVTFSIVNANAEGMMTRSIDERYPISDAVSAVSGSQLLNEKWGAQGKFQFVKVAESADQMGGVHTTYKQTFDGIDLEGCMAIVHSRGGLVTSVNGQVANIAQVKINRTKTIISKQHAENRIRVASGLNAVPVTAEKIYARIMENGVEVYRLAYRSRVSSIAHVRDCMVYVDANSGETIQYVDMRMKAVQEDVMMNTYYNGKKNITFTVDENGAYALLDTTTQNYTFFGTTGVPEMTVFTDSALAVHNQEMIDRGKIYTKELDDWKYYSIGQLTVDSIDLAWDSVKSVEKGRYAVRITKNDSVIYRCNDFDLYFVKPPFTWNIPFLEGKVERDSTYKVELATFYTDLFGPIDSVFFSQEITITKGDTIEFEGDSIMGNFVVSAQPNHALDVHYAMSAVYRYFDEVHNHKSYDGHNSPIYQFVDMNDSYFGAVATQAFAWAVKPYFIATGTGDYYYTNPFASFDMLAHEFAHLVAVTNGREGLANKGEAGALNEALADCFAVCSDFYLHGDSANWFIGDGVMIGAPNMRDVSNPKHPGNGESGFMINLQADTYGGENWKDPNDLTFDNGGVHFNNGVCNYWFYLLTEGGSGTNDLGHNYSVEGLGMQKSEKLLMHMVLNYILYDSRYVDARIASLQAAEDLWGEGCEERDVVDACWAAVGVTETTDVTFPEMNGAQLEVYAVESGVMVATDPNIEIEVFNLVGQKLASVMSDNGYTTIGGLQSGSVVIVRAAGNSCKVIVK